MSINLPVTIGTIGTIEQLTIDARALHEALGVKRDFSNWIKSRITKYSFKENEDFIVFAKSGENSLGGRNSIEYVLTVNMGKELAMVENNERGRMVRRYFIECERRAHSPQPTAQPLPSTSGLSTVSDRRVLNALMKQWADVSGLTLPVCWSRFNKEFNLQSVSELPTAWLIDAEAWVQSHIDDHTTVPALSEFPTPRQAAKLDNKIFTRLLDIMMAMYHAASLDRSADNDFNNEMIYATNCIFMAQSALARAKQAALTQR